MTYATVCVLYVSYLNTSNNLQNLSTRIDHIGSLNEIMVQSKVWHAFHFTCLVLEILLPLFFIWQSVTVKTQETRKSIM